MASIATETRLVTISGATDHLARRVSLFGKEPSMIIIRRAWPAVALLVAGLAVVITSHVAASCGQEADGTLACHMTGFGDGLYVFGLVLFSLGVVLLIVRWVRR